MSESRLVVNLAQAKDLGPEQAGSKAANLAVLLAAGFPVPPGFVITAQALGHLNDVAEAMVSAAKELGDESFAVRSSASAEDLAGASYAGQYDTFLNVHRDGLLEAVRRCWESGMSGRVAAYEDGRPLAVDKRPSAMAVLVQGMVPAEAAGVAFTANPVTGARDEVVLTAVRGLGERLVSGEAMGDEWIVRRGEAICRRAREQAIDAAQARAIATLASRVAQHFAAPQDIEWAVAGGDLYLLQARPMTALPQPVEWSPPTPGYWMRNFRLGEWLPEAMTPLFQDWLLELIEDGYLRGMQQTIGAKVPFEHTAINGWYYTAAPRVSPRLLTSALVQSRGRLIPFLFNVLIRVGTHPEAADRAVLKALAEKWRSELLPSSRRLVEEGMSGVDQASWDELFLLIDQVGRSAGEYLFSLAVVGGSAWKMEGCLAKFHRRHLAGKVEGSVQILLRSLPGAEPDLPPYAVQSVDWYRATAGELGWASVDPRGRDRQQRLIAERKKYETECRVALADAPKLLGRFETLLEVTQRYAGIREEQARHFTLGWPLLRRSALRLGDMLRVAGAIDDPEDVFFLTHDELARRADSRRVVRQRRAEWERQRRLIAPLAIGKAPKLMEAGLSGAVEAVRTTSTVPDGAIVGEPASPGRASGRVRIVRGPEDFDRFEAGEVLVAQATAPMWTVLFARAAAVVTDGGTLAAHASLVAREYGIPAVVGTGDATARLRDGQVVTVDGGMGVVLTQS